MNNSVHTSTKSRPYQVVFGRASYLTENNMWLDSEERRTANVINEDGNPDDDEDSINFQAQ